MVADQHRVKWAGRSDASGLRVSFRGGFFLVFTIFLAIFFSAQTFAQPVAKEYQVKAAFLYNFAQFVQWPSGTFSSADEPFVIGVLGENPFGTALEQTVNGESIRGHRFKIVHSRRIQDVEHCHMVFISKSERARLPEIMQRLAGRKILTVSEVPGFASRGGVINFYPEGSKVRFEINPAAAQREGLKISSQLLNLGKIVEPEISKGGP